ncbi:DUF636 domain protein [Phlyctema vagabunda]|uniref:DUF636 domain protein n=1 Tax=Phlyctema vagabunda TaxID=108571 RepID=A0ABR4PDE7_9HELO
MPSGGCFCNKIRLSFTGDIEGHVLCHCLDCRKISGGTFSDNIVVLDSNFKLESGTPKTISKIADTGNKVTSHFCGDCGTTLFRTGASFGDKHVIKAGVLDDPTWQNENVPKGELFHETRMPWIPKIDDAAQVTKMGN